MDLQDEYGDTPLHAASGEGHLDFVRALLSAGALVDGRNVDGRTALHQACYVGHMEVIRALLSAGAQVDLQDRDGVKAVEMALRAQRPAVERLVRRALKRIGGSRAALEEKGDMGGRGPGWWRGGVKAH